MIGLGAQALCGGLAGGHVGADQNQVVPPIASYTFMTHGYVGDAAGLLGECLWCQGFGGVPELGINQELNRWGRCFDTFFGRWSLRAGLQQQGA